MGLLGWRDVDTTIPKHDFLWSPWVSHWRRCLLQNRMWVRYREGSACQALMPLTEPGKGGTLGCSQTSGSFPGLVTGPRCLSEAETVDSTGCHADDGRWGCLEGRDERPERVEGRALHRTTGCTRATWRFMDRSTVSSPP
jgi:hypothetical protein